MKTLHISLSITLFFISSVVFGQYMGGDGDGSIEFSTPMNYLDGSLRTSLFYGGSGDGFSMDKDSAIYLDGVTVFAHLQGGNGDGSDFYTARDFYVNGTSIGDSYGGGDGDGSEVSRLGVQFLEGSVLATTYQGGDGDGADRDTISFRFLDGSLGCAIYLLEVGETDSIMNGTYSQNLTVYYAFDPGIGNLIVNDQAFPITGSPQNITLTGLNPNGMPVDVTASFTDLPDCKTTEFALFFAPDTTTSSLHGELIAEQIQFSARPNPFSSLITFSVELNRPGYMSMDLMTFSGQKISTIFEGEMEGGNVKEIAYRASNLPQGMYLCRLNVNGHIYYQKLVKLK